VASSTSLHEVQLVTFFLNSQEYAVDVMSVREITSMVGITKAANSPPHVEGIINLRGDIVPIISLRKCFAMPELDDLSASCIAIMDFSGTLTGFIIDDISDVMRIRYDDIQPPLNTVSQPWIEGIINKEQRLIVFMNLKHLTDA